MTRTIWLCLRCGWRRRFDDLGGELINVERHERRCDRVMAARTLDEHGRITGGPRSRQP